MAYVKASSQALVYLLVKRFFNILQAFGKISMIGVVILGTLHAICGVLFWHWVRFIVPRYTARSDNFGSWVKKLLDWSLIISGFTLGFVMIAGAGAI